ncbi:uncharacterized protein LOC132167969 [Corylus avellana]|uniref:uncharacterized protein LOC132167969 n=1 Tax=Corylus avellana TaxID=13451 RepID=UPI00286BBF80|nr:uncharacterized protein LOC132167969 [Corylus avellana]
MGTCDPCNGLGFKYMVVRAVGFKGARLEIPNTVNCEVAALIEAALSLMISWIMLQRALEMPSILAYYGIFAARYYKFQTSQVHAHSMIYLKGWNTSKNICLYTRAIHLMLSKQLEFLLEFLLC